MPHEPTTFLLVDRSGSPSTIRRYTMGPPTNLTFASGSVNWDLEELGVIDEIVKEPLGGAQRDHQRAASTLRRALRRHLIELKKLSPEELLEQRYKKFREMGRFKIDK